jgi:hypothetical protein
MGFKHCVKTVLIKCKKALAINANRKMVFMNIHRLPKKGFVYPLFGLLILLLGYSLPATADASDNDINHYYDGYTAMLEAQIDQLYHAIAVLSEDASLPDQERFKRIGEPSFTAIDKALADKGFTLKSLYRFQSQNQTDITQWLSRHSNEASTLNGLLFERDQLTVELDNSNSSNTSTANTYSGTTHSENQGAASDVN